MLPEYENMLRAIYETALHPGEVAIDIGAHTGLHTVPMARAVGNGGKVFAFEPLTSANKTLRAVVAKASEDEKDIGSVTCFDNALGEEEGETEFIHVQDFPEYSGFKERIYHSQSIRREKVLVTVKTLDSLGGELPKARFIKIDAEGGELTILRGGREYIRQHLPIVSIEIGNAALVNYPYTSGDYFDFFADLGYTIFSIYGIELSRDDFLQATEEQFYWDYIAIPNASGWPFGHDHLRILFNQLGHLSENSSVQSTDGHSSRNLNRVISRLKQVANKFRVSN
jgi:FkbM family methyltransferase